MNRAKACVVVAVLVALLNALPVARAADPPSRSRRIGRHLGQIVEDGDSSVYLSGYAYHKRNAYDPRLIAILNENAWGGGFGRTLRLKNGNVASVAFTAFKDSLDEWEYNLGYMHEWRSRRFLGCVELGAGLTAFITSRTDFLDRVPFPAALPQVTLSVGQATAIASFVPRFPRWGPPDGLPQMNGDVVYLYGRFNFR